MTGNDSNEQRDRRGSGDPSAVEIKRTGRRRVSTSAVPGSDPDPQSATGRPERAAEDTDLAWGQVGAVPPAGRDSAARGENDERLKLDKPPHWQ